MSDLKRRKDRNSLRISDVTTFYYAITNKSKKVSYTNNTIYLYVERSGSTSFFYFKYFPTLVLWVCYTDNIRPPSYS